MSFYYFVPNVQPTFSYINGQVAPTAYGTMTHALVGVDYGGVTRWQYGYDHQGRNGATIGKGMYDLGYSPTDYGYYGLPQNQYQFQGPGGSASWYGRAPGLIRRERC
ncbi:hypothetical protein Tdes44962_MAKER04821 [Teratosphaeria destructans]|uniref:Uncharacterized protein n=1 Tax=Teratosphaeria destructans TaxID=418781 RepID=A0A9W7SLH5_9PEZI|nr:hypothetical protein Tdes44962_MAKER04821 [Teratosphaeria destructans]